MGKWMLAPVVAALLAGLVAPAQARPHTSVQQGVDAIVAGGLPGVLTAVSEPGRDRLYRAGVGDRRRGTPIPWQAELRAGSIGKTFTAVTVLRLVAAGSIRLDERVETYLPGVLRGDDEHGRREITIRQLLQHTSGLPDYGSALPQGADFVANRFRAHEPMRLIGHALDRPQLDRPGRRWVYVNTGYLLLGKVIERVTGRPWAEVVTAQVIRPLGLSRTYLPRPHEVTLRGPHPRGYLAVDGRLADVTELDSSYLDASGSVVSTPAELNRFFRAVLGGELLPPPVQAELTTWRAGGPTAPFYGLGLERFPLSCGDYVGHGGEMHGFSGLSGVLVRRDGGLGRAVTTLATGRPAGMPDFARVLTVAETALCG
ncbi:beta-lactamase family protein [Crossiella sp. SN42]|uniref:serine hydrolase domain-containing protein n=1 Tax=Crossiella sp. SN42 TaxID=2944808 RepID=UPI00207C268C|nr:serine hydrolase domain-containing protein [Crossiella sp. SN42]MCO1579487.1 beta-lactamase family protein [Crossiella sp. SN42]